MRARNARGCRIRKGRYFLRDLAGFADVERLLATKSIGERLSPVVADDDDDDDDDALADVSAPSAAPRLRGLRRQR